MAKLEITTDYRTLINGNLICNNSIVAEAQIRALRNVITNLYGSIRQLWRVTTAMKKLHRSKPMDPGRYFREHFDNCYFCPGTELNECYLVNCHGIDQIKMYNCMVCDTIEGGTQPW